MKTNTCAPLRAVIVHPGSSHRAAFAVAHLFADWLEHVGLEVSLDPTADLVDALPATRASLIVALAAPTQMSEVLRSNIRHAVSNGAGLAACRIAACRSCPDDVAWSMMVGGQCVAEQLAASDAGRTLAETSLHRRHWITRGMGDFSIDSPRCYLHIDPASRVLASTVIASPEAQAADDPVRMPVAWTKTWGAGRIFASAIGDKPAVLAATASARLILRGMIWCANAIDLWPFEESTSPDEDAALLASVDAA